MESAYQCYRTCFGQGPGENKTPNHVLNIDRQIPLNDNDGASFPEEPQQDPEISGQTYFTGMGKNRAFTEVLQKRDVEKLTQKNELVSYDSPLLFALGLL